ncbi:MAG TPA: XrtA-associated tyrosine autokinase [Casimicrobiaceae bacterium]|nr:XrtA-associated tyrosine autokinase [Casimicrobiaceae bacterium]
MSLIEQAAKRLKELENAGVLPPDRTTGMRDPLTDELPTPEAVVRALERSNAADRSHAATAVLETPPMSTPAARDAREPKRKPAESVPIRQHEIDLAALAKQGFISPEAPTQLVDEFRVVKRPILRNVTARAGNKVRDGNLIMVTSALPGEGKTFTAVNLAISIALEYDHTVLLVDGDVAHPQLPELLGIPREPGLLDLLTRDDIDVSATLLRTNIEKLTIMAAGSRHPRATELLASEQMAMLLRELGSRYRDRIIIFDSPPLLATTEARVMASHMGQILMVVAADATAQHAVQGALNTIESCEIVLMMLNKAARTEVGAYYGYYGDAAKR